MAPESESETTPRPIKKAVSNGAFMLFLWFGTGFIHHGMIAYERGENADMMLPSVGWAMYNMLGLTGMMAVLYVFCCLMTCLLVKNTVDEFQAASAQASERKSAAPPDDRTTPTGRPPRCSMTQSPPLVDNSVFIDGSSAARPTRMVASKFADVHEGAARCRQSNG